MTKVYVFVNDQELEVLAAIDIGYGELKVKTKLGIYKALRSELYTKEVK